MVLQEGEIKSDRRIIGFSVSDVVSPVNTLPFFNFNTKMWELLTHISEEHEFDGEELIEGFYFTPSSKFIRAMVVGTGFSSSAAPRTIVITITRISDSFVIGTETIPFIFSSANMHQSLGTHLIELVTPLQNVEYEIIMSAGDMSVDSDDQWELYLLN